MDRTEIKMNRKKYAHNARTLRINLHKISGTQNNMHTDETKNYYESFVKNSIRKLTSKSIA